VRSRRLADCVDLNAPFAHSNTECLPNGVQCKMKYWASLTSTSKGLTRMTSSNSFQFGLGNAAPQRILAVYRRTTPSECPGRTEAQAGKVRKRIRRDRGVKPEAVSCSKIRIWNGDGRIFYSAAFRMTARGSPTTAPPGPPPPGGPGGGGNMPVFLPSPALA